MSIDDIANTWLQTIKYPGQTLISRHEIQSLVRAAYLAGLEVAKGKCEEQFKHHAAKHKKTGGDPYHEGAADVADQCEQAIDQLIKEAKQ